MSKEEEEEEEEEGLFKADAVNEEDPERDRATHKVSEHAGLAVGRRRRHGRLVAWPSGRARPRGRVARVPRGPTGRPRAPAGAPGRAAPGASRPTPGRGATPWLAVGRRRRHGTCGMGKL